MLALSIRKAASRGNYLMALASEPQMPFHKERHARWRSPDGAQEVANKMEANEEKYAYSFIIRRAADMALDLHRLVHLATHTTTQPHNHKFLKTRNIL
jgi:hypothetical protein